jgi:hypothetical protein
MREINEPPKIPAAWVVIVMEIDRRHGIPQIKELIKQYYDNKRVRF